MNKVSIIIPTYKRDINLLDRAVQSLLNQSYKNIEIIIIDDNGGEDLNSYRNTIVKYIKRISKIDKRIKYIQNQTNLGEAFARNVGIEAASGDYITFLDDDDVYLKDKIKHQLEFMIQNNLNCSFTNLSIYNKNNKLIDRRTRNDITSFDKDNLIVYHLTKMITGTDTFMISKKILLDIGGFEQKFGEEFYLMFKILNNKKTKVGFCPYDDIKLYRAKQSCLSNGPNKINGEKKLYQFKKQHFYLLNKKEIKYIKFRHRVVMSISYYRKHKYFQAILYLFKSFFSSPILSIKETIAFKRRLKKII